MNKQEFKDYIKMNGVTCAQITERYRSVPPGTFLWFGLYKGMLSTHNEDTEGLGISSNYESICWDEEYTGEFELHRGEAVLQGGSHGGLAIDLAVDEANGIDVSKYFYKYSSPRLNYTSRSFGKQIYPLVFEEEPKQSKLKTFMNNITRKIADLKLSAHEKLLRKYSMHNSEGYYTQDLIKAVLTLEAQELGFKSWDEVERTINNSSVEAYTALEIITLVNKHEAAVIDICLEQEKEEKKK